MLAEMSQAIVGRSAAVHVQIRRERRREYRRAARRAASLSLSPFACLRRPALNPTLLAREMRNLLKDLASPRRDHRESIRRDPTLEILRLAQAWQPSQEARRFHDVWFRAG